MELNGTVFIGDCLDFLEDMPNDTVDLIYADPPFNSGQNYSSAAGEFSDKWDSSNDYLDFMQDRLVEIQRILKPTGSIYLHCDHHESHYLKVIMDKIFSRQNHRADIIWKRTSAHSDSKSFGCITDVILFYGTNINTDAIREPLNPDYVSKYYRYKDSKGQYAAHDLSAKGLNGGRYYYNFHGHEGPWRFLEHRMKQLEAEGKIHLPEKPGGVPRLKRYPHENKGQVPSNLWTDIKPVHSHSKERIGYPTQKPLALLNRIIQASSKPDDMVLDPFCGSGTTLVAAQQLDRQFTGIDISEEAAKVSNERLQKAVEPLFEKAA